MDDLIPVFLLIGSGWLLISAVRWAWDHSVFDYICAWLGG
jgi:hypothetical protein